MDVSLRAFFLQPIDDLAEGIEVHIAKAPRRGMAIAWLFGAAALTWWIYVQVHEPLHVAGCVGSGGRVSELQIKPVYGGTLLARVFPFVVSGGDYAGRLTGFDTKGSDLIYLATDFTPFMLSVFIGVPLLNRSLRKYAPAVFGAAVVLGLAPILNLTGDYYEMGSIVTSRALMLVSGSGSSAVADAIRSDDIFRLMEELWTRRQELQLDTPGSLVVAYLLSFVSLVAGLFLALATYAVGTAVAKAGSIFRSSR